MNLRQKASRVNDLPVLKWLSPAANNHPTLPEIEGHLQAQLIAKRAVREVAKHIDIGWTEVQAATMVDNYLRDAGVSSFFHKSFAWWADRTRFEGVKVYRHFLPTQRTIKANDVFILDVAPIYNGFICDIGYTACLGHRPDLDQALAFLAELKQDIPRFFETMHKGGEIWDLIDRRIGLAGYDNIHALYPFSVLGHRVHRIRSGAPWLTYMNFGWQSYWTLLSRGVFGQLLNHDFEGDLNGLWAIEPHVGAPDFGAKFEEILAVENGKAYWIEKQSLLPAGPISEV